MTSYRMMLVVAKSQQRPLDFWLVTGPVLNSTWVLKTWGIAIWASREISVVFMLLWVKMVRASWIFGSAAAVDSQASMLASWMVPLPDLGSDGDVSIPRALFRRVFSSIDLLVRSAALVDWEATFEVAEPMVREEESGMARGPNSSFINVSRAPARATSGLGNNNSLQVAVRLAS